MCVGRSTVNNQYQRSVTISQETHSFALAQHLVTLSTHREYVQHLRAALDLLWNMPVSRLLICDSFFLLCFELSEEPSGVIS